ncbi:hypothetical protein L2E82_52083 [Cichorium intybus]|nr:hypothetical protein L2E82_52083 [Cichorium intybus]
MKVINTARLTHRNVIHLAINRIGNPIEDFESGSTPSLGNDDSSNQEEKSDDILQCTIDLNAPQKTFQTECVESLHTLLGSEGLYTTKGKNKKSNSCKSLQPRAKPISMKFNDLIRANN